MRGRLGAAAEAHSRLYRDRSVSDRLSDLENLLAESRRKYQDVLLKCLLTSSLKPVADVTATVTEAAGNRGGGGRRGVGDDDNRDEDDDGHDNDRSRSPISSDRLSREDFLKSLTWDEINTTARVLATEKYRSRKEDPDRIQSAVLFPQFLLTEDDLTGRDDDFYTDLLLEPYRLHYDAVKMELTEKGRTVKGARSRMATTARPGIDMDIVTTVVPSQWVMDFLYVFCRSRRIGAAGYPRFHEMEDVFYVTRALSLVRQTIAAVPPPTGRVTRTSGTTTTAAATTTITTPVKLKNYCLDLGYHLMRFASLFTTLSFTPMKGSDMSPETYADFEFLVHYAMLRTKDVDYADFLNTPNEWLSGPGYVVLSTAVADSVDEIAKSFSVNYFFKATRHGPYLQRRVRLHNGDTVKEDAPVPDSIMSGLAMHVLPNVSTYMRNREIDSFQRPADPTPRDLRTISPIGRYLNFDQSSVSEFAGLRKESGACGDFFNVQLSDRLATLPCIHRAYAMLVSAAATVRAAAATSSGTGESPRLGVVLNKCMHVSKDHATTLYCSTAEAFPGLLFYTMLAAGEKDAKVLDKVPMRNATDTEVSPGMSAEDFFHKRTDRRAFFDVFGIYSHKVTPMSASRCSGNGYALPVDTSRSGEGIRWVNRRKINEIRSSAGKVLWEAQAAFVSLLGLFSTGNVADHRRIGHESDTLRYFFKNAESYQRLTTFAEYSGNPITFFTEPVMYFSRTDFVDKTVSKSSAVARDPVFVTRTEFKDLLQTNASGIFRNRAARYDGDDTDVDNDGGVGDISDFFFAKQ